MRFADSETQKLIRNTARSYLSDKFPWERLYALERGDAQLTADDLREIAAMGWTALVAPEAEGGGGASLLEAAVVVDECGYAAAPLPLAVSNVAADLMSRAPGGSALSQHLAALAQGRALYTVAESARRRGPLSVPSASNGALSGTVRLVPFGGLADFLLAPAIVGGEYAFALVPLSAARREPLRMLDRPVYCNLHLDGIPVSDCLILARGQEAERLHERCDALSTAFGLIELGGMMQRVLEMTTEYISNRVQFGQPIAKFQAARHRAAELLMQTETTRWASYYALWEFQKDPQRTEGIWLAKHWAIRAADRVFHVSHLLTGGVGVGSEYPLHLFTQAIAAYAVRGGTAGEMVDRTVDALALRRTSSTGDTVGS